MFSLAVPVATWLSPSLPNAPVVLALCLRTLVGLRPVGFFPIFPLMCASLETIPQLECLCICCVIAVWLWCFRYTSGGWPDQVQPRTKAARERTHLAINPGRGVPHPDKNPC